jgi:hypothetical protein
MFKKSFSEILQLNLDPTIQFKIKPPDTIQQTVYNEYTLELYNLFLKESELKNIYGSRTFYKKLFKKPVEKLFYWCEDDLQGQLFVIYKYKNKYIYISANFGSCEVCDFYPYNSELLNKSFNSLIICNNIDNINIHIKDSKYTHTELVKLFNKFKIKYKKKEPHQEPQPHQEPRFEYKESKSWTSLFK